MKNIRQLVVIGGISLSLFNTTVCSLETYLPDWFQPKYDEQLEAILHNRRNAIMTKAAFEQARPEDIDTLYLNAISRIKGKLSEQLLLMFEKTWSCMVSRYDLHHGFRIFPITVEDIFNSPHQQDIINAGKNFAQQISDNTTLDQLHDRAGFLFRSAREELIPHRSHLSREAREELQKQMDPLEDYITIARNILRSGQSYMVDTITRSRDGIQLIRRSLSR